MAPVRYPQFCALARAAEVLGERWTLLIVRELLIGPRRFSDLRARLDGISPSVLTERLARTEALALVHRRMLPAPAASTVYELTELGQALRPAVYELIRWGGQLLQPARPGERMEPEWMALALAALARRGPSPSRRLQLRVRAGRREAVLHVAGGRRGTSVSVGEAPAEATLIVSVPALLNLVSGRVPVRSALDAGVVEARGDLSALADLPRLFDAVRSSAPQHRKGHEREARA